MKKEKKIKTYCQPLSVEEYNKDVLKAIERIEKGEYITQEEALKRLKNYL